MGDYKRRRQEAMVQKEALYTLGLVAKRVPKKEVVSFWFLFLPDRSYSPLSSSVTSLCVNHTKKIRQQALSIMAEFLNHSGQFLNLAICKEEKEFSKLCSVVSDSWDLVESSLRQSIRRISPEKSSSFLAASQTAEMLSEGRLAGKEEVVMLCKLLKELSMDWDG